MTENFTPDDDNERGYGLTVGDLLNRLTGTPRDAPILIESTLYDVGPYHLTTVTVTATEVTLG